MATKLFQPIRVGTTNLQHRIVLAPMKQSRADERYVLGALGLEYYKQRTSVPGTLAITEGTFTQVDIPTFLVSGMMSKSQDGSRFASRFLIHSSSPPPLL
jgi:NADPH2 dehydrogenase